MNTSRRQFSALVAIAIATVWTAFAGTPKTGEAFPDLTKANLEVITHEGMPDEKRIAKVIDLTKPEPVVIRLEAGRRTKVLPLSIAPLIPPTTGPSLKEKAKADADAPAAKAKAEPAPKIQP